MSSIVCQPKPRDLAVERDVERFIAHAGGAIDGNLYTNSREALLQAIQAGFRLIELDLITTSDGHLVAAHDWPQWARMTGVESIPPTLEEFLGAKLHQKYTPMSLEQVKEIFLDNPDLILVTDKTRDFGRLLDTFPHPDRLLVEIFSEPDLKLARRMGVKHLMPSFFWGRSDVRKIVDQYQISFVALHTGSLTKNDALLRQMVRDGVCVFAFSSNQMEFVEANIPNRVFGIYTDYFVPRNGSFECQGECRTY